MVEWAFRRSGYLADDEHFESMIVGRLRSMTIEGAPAQLRMRGLSVFTSRVPFLRTNWMLYRSSRRLFVGAGFGLALPVELSMLWRVSIDEDSTITLVYSGAGLTALRFEKVRRDKSAPSVWGPEWVAEVTAAREHVYAGMSLEDRGWMELWRTELEESGALDRIEASLIDREDLRAPRDGIDSKGWHRLLSAMGAIGRNDAHGLTLALRWIIDSKSTDGAIAVAYGQHLLGVTLSARIGTEPSDAEIDALARSMYARWSTVMSLLSPYDESVLRAGLRLAAGRSFDGDALDGRRAQAVVTTLGVLLEQPVPDLIAARPAIAAWGKKARVNPKTVESIAPSKPPTVESCDDLNANWLLLRRAILAGVYGDTQQFMARLVEHEKQFEDRGPGSALLFYALREVVLRRLEGRGSRTDLGLLAAEAAPRYSTLLNKLELVDLEEVLEWVFQFRESTERTRGANFRIRVAGAIAVLVNSPRDDLDAISDRVLERAAQMIASAREGDERPEASPSTSE